MHGLVKGFIDARQSLIDVGIDRDKAERQALDELIASLRVKAKPLCKYGDLLQSPIVAEIEELDLNAPDVSHLLKELGHNVSATTIRIHRDHRCRCA